MLHAARWCLDHKVSRLHARVFLDSSGIAFVEDLGSANGTYLNGNIINEPRALNIGDHLNVGDTSIELSMVNEAEGSPGLDKPMDYISIGRDAGNNLILNDSGASRQHARIERRENKFYLTDLGSANGTYLNGNRITSTVEIEPAVWLTICGTNYWFDGSSLKNEQGELLASFGSSSGEGLTLSEVIMIPFQQGGILKVILGALLIMIPLVSFFAEGYRFRVFQESTSGKMNMPVWDDWRELFIKGLIFYLVQLVYLVPALLFILLSIVILDSWPAAGISTFVLLAGFCYLLVAATAFFLPMSWAHFTSTGRFNSIFEFSVIIRRIKSIFPRYLFSVFFLALLWVILGLTAIIPVFGIIMLIFGGFYIYLLQALLFGELYRLSEPMG